MAVFNTKVDPICLRRTTVQISTKLKHPFQQFLLQSHKPPVAVLHKNMYTVSENKNPDKLVGKMTIDGYLNRKKDRCLLMSELPCFAESCH